MYVSQITWNCDGWTKAPETPWWKLTLAPQSGLTFTRKMDSRILPPVVRAKPEPVSFGCWPHNRGSCRNSPHSGRQEGSPRRSLGTKHSDTRSPARGVRPSTTETPAGFTNSTTIAPGTDDRARPSHPLAMGRHPRRKLAPPERVIAHAQITRQRNQHRQRHAVRRLEHQPQPQCEQCAANNRHHQQ